MKHETVNLPLHHKVQKISANLIQKSDIVIAMAVSLFNALTLLVVRHEGHPACKNMGMVEVGAG